MENSTITLSKHACAYSAAVIADAQAAIARATESVQHAYALRQVRQRESFARAGHRSSIRTLTEVPSQ